MFALLLLLLMLKPHTLAHTVTPTHTRIGRLINEFSFSLGLAAGNRQHLQHVSHNNLRRAAVKNFVNAFGGNNNTRTFNFQFMSFACMCIHTYTYVLYNVASAYVSVSPLAPLPFSLCVTVPPLLAPT